MHILCINKRSRFFYNPQIAVAQWNMEIAFTDFILQDFQNTIPKRHCGCIGIMSILF